MAVLLVVPVTIVFAVVMALVPAAMASRTHPAVALREE